jgi:hypothetical protein
MTDIDDRTIHIHWRRRCTTLDLTGAIDLFVTSGAVAFGQGLARRRLLGDWKFNVTCSDKEAGHAVDGLLRGRKADALETAGGSGG